MAELPKNIRRPGGSMVPVRSPFTRRVLLPTEADMCNVLGITEEEYWQFVEQLEAKIKERPEAYDLIPDIHGEIVSTFFTLKTLITIGIAAGAAYVSYLLTPKPQQQKQGTQQRTADIAGTKRFAPQSSFNSVQELANLGDLIPLVFTNRTGHNPNGGIRVASQMMWSQLVSLGRFQRLKIYALFSLGELDAVPDFKGYAIGDLLISNYHTEKILKSGGNVPFSVGPVNTGQYLINQIPEIDAFKIDNKEYFSGTRNPTTQATFGLSSPMPNCTYFNLPYELVRWGYTGGRDNDRRPAYRRMAPKRVKMMGAWPMRCGFAQGGSAAKKRGEVEYEKGDVLSYQVVGGDNNDQSNEGNFNAFQSHGPRGNYGSNGVEDVDSVTSSVRESVDQYIAEGEQYMAGTALVTCKYEGGQDQHYPGQPWEAQKSKTRGYTFEVVEKGHCHVVPEPNLGNHCNNPIWQSPSWDIQNSNPPQFYYGQRGLKPLDEQIAQQTAEGNDFPYGSDIFPPHSRYALQRVSIGTVSDNRKCDITELGLKSKVFKQIQTANVNSKPTEATLVDLIEGNSTLQLGQVSTFTKRISFFKLQIRKAGSTDDWYWLKPSGEFHSGLFCVMGNTPEFQYNYIRVDHDYDQYEYRFLPWPGNDVIKHIENGNRMLTASLLNANSATTQASVQQYVAGTFNEYTVKFAGRLNYLLSKESLSNTEWIVANPQYPSNEIRYFWTLSKNSYSSPNNIEPRDLERTETPLYSKVVDVVNTNAHGTGMQVRLKMWGKNGQTYATWSMEGEPGSGYRIGDKVIIPAVAVTKDSINKGSMPNEEVALEVHEVPVSSERAEGYSDNLNPYDAAADFWKFQQDKSSHLDGPEHSIIYVNEIVRTEGTKRATYENLAYAGLRVDSSKEWTNFTQFSAYIQQGIRIKKPGGGTGATSLFPDIAYALLTDKKLGAGKVISDEAVNEGNLALASNFCKANGYFWDGMISSRVNLRQFIFEQGLYCLLDFTIIGGEFSLHPAVPFNSDYTVNHSATPEIKALFTDGNVKDLQVKFLSPEDRQTFKANVLYREEKLNGFCETKSTIIRLAGSEYEDDPIETYDMSGFCTTEGHALDFAKHILSIREYTDHTVNFKTAPHYVNGVKPGDYIRVFSTTNHTSRFNNGAILEDGTVVSKDTITGAHHIYYWKPSEQEVRETPTNPEQKLDFSDANAVKAYAGTLFTIKETEKTDQCYKVESITFGEDGLIDLSASYVKLTDDGKLAILQGWGSRFDRAGARFVIED